MGQDNQGHESVRDRVREGYAVIANKGVFSTTDDKPGAECCSGGGCCGPAALDAESLVRSIGYSDSDLAAAPRSSNMGLSCGNPTAIASLQRGETVLDLGCGGGFDVFIAGPRVGAEGKVIGVDMTAEMLAKARKNVALYSERMKLNNVEFRLGEIENLPVADSSVDVVISNCVLNLSPDKQRVWNEIFRVLKPKGRVAISDLALLKPLPEAILSTVEALVGCIAGAVLVSETVHMAETAGLRDINLTMKPEYIDAMSSWEDPLYRKIIAALPEGSRTSDYITSLDLTAIK